MADIEDDLKGLHEKYEENVIEECDSYYEWITKEIENYYEKLKDDFDLEKIVKLVHYLQDSIPDELDFETNYIPLRKEGRSHKEVLEILGKTFTLGNLRNLNWMSSVYKRMKKRGSKGIEAKTYGIDSKGIVHTSIGKTLRSEKGYQ